MWISKERWDQLTGLIAELAERQLALGEKLDDCTDASERAIAELEESYKRGSLKSDEPESVQIDPGHVPFSQRKRNFEATKRQEAASKKKGPQPAKGT